MVVMTTMMMVPMLATRKACQLGRRKDRVRGRGRERACQDRCRTLHCTPPWSAIHCEAATRKRRTRWRKKKRRRRKRKMAQTLVEVVCVLLPMICPYPHPCRRRSTVVAN